MADPQRDPAVPGVNLPQVGPKVDIVLDDPTPVPGAPAAVADQSVDHIALPVGYRLAEYTIESVLGTGGFGLTYLARDNNLDCEVAIKEYLPHDMAVRVEGQTVCARSQEWGQDYQVGLKRFLAEARTLASFRHPNIVRITRFFEANGTAYMVMDYERGQPLREWRRSRPMVTEEEMLRMFLPLLEGLEVVHHGKVTHRDIKPSNIYVRETDGSLVLLDFGSARQTAGATHGLTTIVTPGYAPFEQYHSRGAQGPWSDIYAMGGVMYWMVTGEKPLEAPSRLKEDTMVPVREMAKERFSPAFLAAIDWALQSDENKRPRSVAEFRAALTGQTPVPVAAVPAERTAPKTAVEPPKARRKTPAAVWAGLAVAGLAVAGVGLRHSLFKPAEEPPHVLAAEATAEPAPQPVPPQPATPAVPAAAPVQETVSAPAAAPAPAAPPPAAAKPAAKPTPTKLAAASKQADDHKRASTGELAPAAAQAAPAVHAKLAFKVVPYGDIYLDGKKVGRTPPLAELPVSAGSHKLEIHGDGMPFIANYSIDLKAGETKQIWTKFGND